MTLLKDANGTAGLSYTDLVASQEAVALVVAAATGVTATDTARIQAKLTAAGVSGATEVHLREGGYSFTSLTFPVTATGTIKLIGQGIGKTTLTCTGTSGYAITFGDAGATDDQRAYLQDLTLIGNANMDGGVRLSHTRFTGIDRVKIQDFTKAGAKSVSTTSGTAQSHNYFCRISHCQFRNSPTGIALTTSAGIGGNSNYVEFCHFGVHTSQAILIDGGTGNVLLGNEINGSTAIGVRLQSAAQHNKLIGNQFDGPTLTVDLDPATVLDTNLIGNTSLANVTTSGVALTGAQYISTRTARIDSTGAAIPAIINGGIEVGNFTQTNPTDGVGALGAIRSNVDLRAHSGDATKETRILDGYVLTPALAATPSIPRAFYTDVNGRLVYVNASNQPVVMCSTGYLARTANHTQGANREFDLFGYTLSGATQHTLPAASGELKGRVFTVKDESGNAAVNNLTIARAGADTWEGGGTTVVISTNFGFQRFYTDGVSKWFKC